MDIGNIKLVLFTERDNRLAPLDSQGRGAGRMVGSMPNGHVTFSICVDAAVVVTSVAQKEIWGRPGS